MGFELAAEHLHHIGALFRAVDADVGEAQDRIGAVQRQPAPAIFKEGADRHRLPRSGHQVAGIGDQKTALRDPRYIAVIIGHGGANFGTLGEQLKQFEPREIDVVILPCGDKMGIDPGHRQRSMIVTAETPGAP